MTQKVTLSEALDFCGQHYTRTLNKVVAIEERRDEGEPFDFKTAAELYEQLRSAGDDLRQLEDERRQLEEEHAGLEEPQEAIPAHEEGTATAEQTRLPDYGVMLRQSRQLLLDSFAALEERAQVGNYNDRRDALREMRAFAKEIIAWGVAAALNSARIEGKIGSDREREADK